MDKLLKTHSFCFNENDNGGESFYITTKMYDNGDGPIEGVYWIQDFTLMSYGNCATINFSGKVTPAKLRKLADELELAEREVRNAT